MILCRYFDENGLDILCNLRLKVTNPTQLNDPFEFSPFIEGEFKRTDFKRYIKHPASIDRLYVKYNHIVKARNKKEFKQIIRDKNIDEIFKNIEPNFTDGIKDKVIDENVTKFCEICRVLCFSHLEKLKEHEEILMWSYYANSHTGLRISFDTNKIKLKSKGPDKVEYCDERVMLNVRKLVIFDPKVFEDFGKSLLVKSTAWAYECEHRWLIHPVDWFNDKSYDFIKIFSDAIIRVDIGVNSTKEFKSSVIHVLKLDQFKHVDVRMAEVDKKKFRLCYNKL